MDNMKKKDLKKSKVFCMAPWTHMHFMPNKDVNPCCLSPIHETIGNMNNQDIPQIWNSDRMKQLRKDMLEGNERPDFCYRCYEKENDGFTSLRTHMNDSYLENHYGIVEQTTEDGRVDPLNLIHWDFRFSNVCNQKCRTCGIEFSTQWHADFIKLWDLDKNHPSTPPKVKRIWIDELEFEKDFDTFFDKVEYIHFAGGEPLITDEHYKVLDRLIEAGRSDVRLRYSTNFNALKYKKYDILEMWKHFDHIELMASIDDMGDRYNYIRKGGNWDKVVANFSKFKDSGLFERPNMHWGLHPTISFWNIYYMPDFHRECIKLGMIDVNKKHDHWFTTFHLNNLIQPKYYNCQILLPHLKKQVTDKLLAYADELEKVYKIPSDPFRNLVTYMNQEDKTNQIPKMQNMTHRLDKIRAEETPKIFPFIKEMFDVR